MLFTAYGNCQADVISNLLQQSPEFAAQYRLARMRPCFAISEEEIAAWHKQSAQVALLLTQKLRKGWRGGAEVFDTDWLMAQCAPDVTRLEWSDMYYSAYEPHMTYPLTFPRRPPSDYINILHMLVYANDLAWQRLEPFYGDAGIFPAAYIEEVHAAALGELSRREADCSLQIAPFIAGHWREERLFMTFNHPGRRVVRHAANQVLDQLGIADPVPETGYHGFVAASALPLLASFDAMLAKPEARSIHSGFFLTAGAVTAAEYFGRWENAFDELGREKVRGELAAHFRSPGPRRDLLAIAARHLELPDPS